MKRPFLTAVVAGALWSLPSGVMLAGCVDTAVHLDGTEGAPPARAPSTYIVETDTDTEPGEQLVTAVAACDPGDRIVGGGCSWGEPADPHDPPLAPVVAAPEGEAYVCRGQFRGVGNQLKVVRATAICAAGGAS